MLNKRSMIGAILGASLLTLGVTSAALAVVLVEEHEAIIAGWDAEGEPFAQDKFGDPIAINTSQCDVLEIEPAEIVLLFSQDGDALDPTVANPGGTSANVLDVDLNDGEIFLEDVEAWDIAAGLDGVEWLIAVDPPGDELELVSANSNVDGGDLIVLAICFFQDPDTAKAATSATDGSKDGIWALVLALGVLLASLVLFSPSRRRSEVPPTS